MNKNPNDKQDKEQAKKERLAALNKAVSEGKYNTSTKVRKNRKRKLIAVKPRKKRGDANADGDDGVRLRKSKPWARIHELQCFQEVYERICAGYPLPDVARFIQDEKGEYTDIKRTSLIEHLRQYSREIVPADLIAPRLPHAIVLATKEFGDRLENLRRMERVYEALLYRFDMSHGEERRTGRVRRDVDRQARTIMDLIVKMHDMQLDLGLGWRRDLGSLSLIVERINEIREKYGEGASRAFADPVQRGQVLGLLKKILRIQDRALGGETIDIDSEGRVLDANGLPVVITGHTGKRDVEKHDNDSDEQIWVEDGPIGVGVDDDVEDLGHGDADGEEDVSLDEQEIEIDDSNEVREDDFFIERF